MKLHGLIRKSRSRPEYQFCLNEDMKTIITFALPYTLSKELDAEIERCAKTTKGWARFGIRFQAVTEKDAWPIIKGQEWQKEQTPETDTM